jgi:hypothetical protein
MNRRGFLSDILARLDPQVTVTNHRALSFFVFHGMGRVSMPLSLWVRCLYWRHFPPRHDVIPKHYKNKC